MISYATIRLGSSNEEAKRIFQGAGIKCDWKSPAGTELSTCTFSDFTHEYRVVLSGASGKVIRKGFGFKVPKLLP